MAEKYLLRVSAGPAYDPSTHKIVNVNSADPLRISGEWGEADLHVRIRNYRGLPKGSPPTCPYFDHALHKSDQYSICFDLLPKSAIPGNELLFGNDFDEPIRDRLPPGFGKAFKLVKWVIDPGLEGDPYADQPHLYGPALSSINILRVGEKKSSLGGHAADAAQTADGDVIEEGGDGDGQKIRDDMGVPKEAGARKKFFLDEEKRKQWEFEAGRLYRVDFFNPYLDFNDFSLKLPGFSLPILKFLDARDIKSHNLRYVLRHRSTGKVYFVVVFAVMLLEDLANEAANEAAEKDAKKAKDEEFEPKEDDLD